MKSATELLEAYVNNIRTPNVSASQFAEDGVLELPWVKAHAQGPAAVEQLIKGLLAKIPDFRFKNLTYYIQTPDKVAAEYQVEALVPDTGKVYHQTYVGVLHAENPTRQLARRKHRSSGWRRGWDSHRCCPLKTKNLRHLGFLTIRQIRSKTEPPSPTAWRLGRVGWIEVPRVRRTKAGYLH